MLKFKNGFPLAKIQKRNKHKQQPVNSGQGRGTVSERKLDRWERYYLERAVHGYVSIPKHSKIVNRMWEHGLLHGTGFVIGRNVEFNLSQLGLNERNKIYEAQRALDTTA
jgi:hypothetical protein